MAISQLLTLRYTYYNGFSTLRPPGRLIEALYPLDRAIESSGAGSI
jgi:hypothetical protein